MSRKIMVLCGVPKEYCTGSFIQTGDKWPGPKLGHSSHEEAFRCYTNYLKKTGHVMVDDNPRQYQLAFDPAEPDKERPIIIVTKVSRFGAVMRKGKEDRFMGKRVGGTLG